MLPARRAAGIRVALAVGVAAALVALLGQSAARASARDRVEALRAEIDAAANDYFDAQRDANRITAEIAELERRLATSTRRADGLRTTAAARVVELYTSAGAAATLTETDDVLDAGRQREFIASANADALSTIDDYVVAQLDLGDALDALEDRRVAQARTIEAAATQQADLEAALVDARATLAAEEAEAARLEAEALFAATSTTATTAPESSGVAPTGGDDNDGTNATTPTTSGQTSPTSPTTPTTPTTTIAPPPPPPGSHPHRNDPFLSCVRQRESRGDYTAVNPAGYYGAYQFAPSTWDATASHAGRFSLVGVRPDRAGVYDQDDMAWVLYQWQGTSPWGGRCP